MKCLAQGHNVIFARPGKSNQQPLDYLPNSLTAKPPDSPSCDPQIPATSYSHIHHDRINKINDHKMTTFKRLKRGSLAVQCAGTSVTMWAWPLESRYLVGVAS